MRDQPTYAPDASRTDQTHITKTNLLFSFCFFFLGRQPHVCARVCMRV